MVFQKERGSGGSRGCFPPLPPASSSTFLTFLLPYLPPVLPSSCLTFLLPPLPPVLPSSCLPFLLPYLPPALPSSCLTFLLPTPRHFGHIPATHTAAQPLWPRTVIGDGLCTFKCPPHPWRNLAFSSDKRDREGDK
ncbi:unnamed protein product [Pleuronectes platessa]|uniref:Uncharacterized protein n=1 Tax=Pleuronectes platessa TaxID=8262 RepID=A0A9N7UAE6_PLEPL|nr:unnamed protein product [Pleuronectes platessa]